MTLNSTDLPRSRSDLDRARDLLGRGQLAREEFAASIDRLVRRLASDAGWDSPDRAVAALGGYGRGELAPFSDLDVLFLVRRNSGGSPPVEAVLYPLWDLGFDVGHALRTPTECAELARSDLSAATALLDARLLLGSRELLESARHRAGIRPHGGRQMRRWAEWIREDVDRRRRRYGEISDVLEPHLKEGTGGLRDFHAGRWLLCCNGGFSAPSPPPPEVEAANGYLSRTRSALHAIARRKADHLTFDFHDEVASLVLPGRTMEEFFEALHRASHLIDVWWEEASQKTSVVRFSVFGGTSTSVRETPELLARRVVAWARDEGAMPAALRQTLREAERKNVADALRRATREILQGRIRLAPLLHELHRLGLLGEVAPELERVVHQVHYDVRHAFTTGVHCIEALRLFEDLWLGSLEREENHLTRIAGGVLRPWVARVAVLAHDLGKAAPGPGHAAAGAEHAERLARRLGLTVEDALEAAELVRRHHALPAIAFRRDLEDPAAWRDAVRDAGGAARLDALLALAFADLKATHPEGSSELWSEWKRDLLLTLYARAVSGSQDDEASRRERIRAAVDAEASRCGVPGLGRDLERLPLDELLHVPPDLLAGLLSLASELGDRPSAWRVEPRGGGFAEMLGVAHPSPCLLSSTMAALSAMRFDVLAFQMHTWPDGTAHLWVRVAHPEGLPRPGDVAARLRQAMADPLQEPVRRAAALPDPRADALPIRPSIRVLTPESSSHTAIEVRCRDRRGLLRDLSRLFEARGLVVSHALVTTSGPVAQDVFHLRTSLGGPVQGEDRLRALLEDLEAAIRTDRGQPKQLPPHSQTEREEP